MPNRSSDIHTTKRELSASLNPSAATDRQIDHLVYDLYGLTGEEIRIVEGLANQQ